MRIARALTITTAVLAVQCQGATAAWADAHTSDLAADAAVTLSAEPRWGPVEPGTWTAYSVTVRNDGSETIEGHVVLVAVPEPAGEPRTSSPESSGVRPLVTALGETEFTTAPDPAASSTTSGGSRGRSPSYRAPISLGTGGSTKTLSILVVETASGHRGELRDRSGGLIAASSPPATDVAKSFEGNDPGPDQRRGYANVAVLSDEPGVQAGIEQADGLFGNGPAQLTTIPTPRDVPSTAMGFTGLRALVVGRFDTTGLSTAQVAAITQYVRLGGSMVVTGGPEARSRLSPLPGELIPMVPTGTASTGVGVIGDLVGQGGLAEAAGSVGVVTGSVAHGQVVLESADGRPLAIQSQVGAGRVVQLTYDPAAQPLASVPLLRDLGWAQGLGRVLPPSGLERVAPDSQLWGDILVARDWPAWPRPAVGMLVAFSLLCGPLAAVRARRSLRPGLVWTVPAASALILLVGVTFVDSSRTGPGDRALTVVVEHSGRAGWSETFRSLGSTRQSTLALDLAPGAVASTTFASANAFAGPPVGLIDSPDTTPTATGSGGTADLLQGSDAGAARLSLRPGEARALQIVDLGPSDIRPAPVWGLETDIHLEHSGRLDQGGVTVKGSVTNRSTHAVHKLRAQLPGGALARLVDTVEPGQTIEVDGRFVAPRRIAQGDGIPAPADEMVMYAAADRSFTAPDQVGVVARGSAGSSGETVVVVDLVDGYPHAVGFGSGSSFLGRAAGEDDNALIAFELGGGPQRATALVYSTYSTPPEVYDWQAHRWRRLPDGDKSVGVLDSTALTPGEVSGQGFVRIRSLGIGGGSGTLLFAEDSP